MEMYVILNYLGLYAPLILFVISIFLLRNMKTYLYFFVIGFGLNNVLNIILKILIKYLIDLIMILKIIQICILIAII